MPQISKLKSSRDQWKAKTSQLTQKNKMLKQAVRRANQKNDLLKAELKEVKNTINPSELIGKTETPIITSKQMTRNICLILVLGSTISFRSSPKILNLFNDSFSLKLQFLPHFTSVINWSLRLGLGLLKQVKHCTEPWVAIADHTIAFGITKALVVLRVKLDVLSKKGSAITLEDCECIGVKICETVNGESTALDFEEIFKVAGHPSAIIKDRDSSLNKGYKLYSKKVNKDSVVIDDLSHGIANALKAEFNEMEKFKLFKTLSNDGAKRIRQTELAFLTPPKLRKKGRFMSIACLAKWGLKMLEILSVKGEEIQEAQREKLLEIFPGFTLLNTFIEMFFKTTSITTNIMKILKNRGMSLETFSECMELADQLSANSVLKVTIVAWLNRHLQIQKNIGHFPLQVSSDIIETLFGKYKSISERTPHSEMNRSVLLLPALCGKLNEANIEKAMAIVKQKDLNDWEDEHVPNTMRKKRSMFFNINRIQKEDQLEVA